MFSTQVIDTYFSLLRKALGFSTSDLLTGSTLNAEDMGSLIRLAQIQGTAPLVYDQLLKADSLLPDEAQMQLKLACMQNMMLQQEMKGVLATAWDALSKGGGKPVLLKGFGLAMLYPQPHLRQWGDIDIYVGADGYHTAADVLRKTFPDNPCFEEEEEYFKHWNINIGNTAIEAHRVSAILIHPCDMRLWQWLERDAMANAQEVEIEGMKLRIPEYRFNSLFVFLHSWHHFTESGSATMKQLCDLALLLHSASLLPHTSSLLSHTSSFLPHTSSFLPHTSSLFPLPSSLFPLPSSLFPLTSYLRHHLRRLRLTQVWQAYAYIMVTYLGLPADECPLYTPKAAKRGERLLNRILNPVRATSHTATPHTNILLRKLSTLRGKIHDSLQAWPISPVYASHDIMGKVLEGLGRLLRGDLNRKWE
ncbi:MAG: nucleotidyltransferase family protein [Bacteroidales bacterium]|nr:nucleotidyltransferase family protein [Candidatus Colicola equi]